MNPANLTIATCQHPVSADIKSNLKAILVRPDGKISGKLSRNSSGVLISKIDLGKSFADPSGHLRDILRTG